MGRVIRSSVAEAGAVEIWAYIAEDDPTAADRLLGRFDEVIRQLSLQPMFGKGVEEIAPRLRFFPVGSYLIFYRAIEDGVETARILHGARDVTADFFRD